MFHKLPQVVLMLEEEHVCEFGVDDVGMTPRHAYEVESLLATVTTAPECHAWLVLPHGARVGLDRQQLQTDSDGKTTAAQDSNTGHLNWESDTSAIAFHKCHGYRRLQNLCVLMEAGYSSACN